MYFAKKLTGPSQCVFHLISISLLLTSAILVLFSPAATVYAGLLYCLASLCDYTAQRHERKYYESASTQGLVSLLVRYLGNSIFFLALGISAYINTGHTSYVFAVIYSVFLWGYFLLLMLRYATTGTGELTGLLAPTNLHMFVATSTHKWELVLLFVYRHIHSWISPVFVLLFCITGAAGGLFYTSSILLSAVIIFILRLLHSHKTDTAIAASRSGTSFLFYMFGISILLLLIAKLPFQDVMESIRVVGPEAIWLLFIPAVWIIPYAITLQVLLNYRVSFRDALYTQISGDAFNSITPLMGLGGEPYKAKHLSNFVSIEDSSRAIVQSRLIHAFSGVLFAAIVMLITVIVVDLSGIPGFALGLGIVSAAMFTISALLLWVTMSPVTSRITGLVLSRFTIIEHFRHDRLSWRVLCGATMYKLIGRTGKFLELYVIFRVLEIVPTFADMVLVEAMIMASISIFFFVPQGIGVNEAGIVTAFTIAGYAAATGVAFGLIRRSRMVVYALFGLVIFLFGHFSQYGKSRFSSSATRTDS